MSNDVELDEQAIEEAARVINTRIESGEIRSLSALAQGLRTEIAFQKIAIRH